MSGKSLDKDRARQIRDFLLTPLAFLYGTGVWIRNKLFDNDFILKQREFDVPVICVGNIAVGGTGKTPHVEYLIEHLLGEYTIGVLSRGYKRKSKGFVLASEGLSSHELGDEPYQIYRKFRRNITLAVCESRTKGIEEMLKINPRISLIILDDAFQHRYVKPKVSVLLCDYNHPPYDDHLMPLGTLREHFMNRLRAHAVVMTKCPHDIKKIEFRACKNGMALFPSQGLFFSTLNYLAPKPVFPSDKTTLASLSELSDSDAVLTITGIAQPMNLVKYINTFKPKPRVLHFDDHHNFTRDDMQFIARQFDELKGSNKYILTTEKDAARIVNNPYFPPRLCHLIYYIPIKVEFTSYEGEDFMDFIRKAIVRKSLI